jgi:hypothetical protein
MIKGLDQSPSTPDVNAIYCPPTLTSMAIVLHTSSLNTQSLPETQFLSSDFVYSPAFVRLGKLSSNRGHRPEHLLNLGTHHL